MLHPMRGANAVQMAVVFLMEGSTLATMAGRALQASVPLTMFCNQIERCISALYICLSVCEHSPACISQRLRQANAPSMLPRYKALKEAPLRVTNCALHISVMSCRSGARQGACRSRCTEPKPDSNTYRHG